mgnify:CR=1 FL=1
MSFTRVLIANRGEIARRIQRGCRKLGLETVAVFSEADRDAPFVIEADHAVCIGGAAPSESYLNVDAILDAARPARARCIPAMAFCPRTPVSPLRSRRQALCLSGRNRARLP